MRIVVIVLFIAVVGLASMFAMAMLILGAFDLFTGALVKREGRDRVARQGALRVLFGIALFLPLLGVPLAERRGNWPDAFPVDAKWNEHMLYSSTGWVFGGFALVIVGAWLGRRALGLGFEDRPGPPETAGP